MCVYNHGKYLADAIEGVVRQQTKFPFRLLIADDCSRDNSRDIIAKYHADYPEIIVPFYREKNLGAQQNSDLLIKECHATYIALCDGDDYWTDVNKLQHQVDFLEANSEYVIHCSNARIVSENPQLNGKPVHPGIDIPKKFGLEDFLEDSRVVTCTAMFRNIGLSNMPDEYRKVTAGDWFLWIYLMNKSEKQVYYDNAFTGAYRMHNTGQYSALNLLGTYNFYIHNLSLIRDYLPIKYHTAIVKKLGWYRRELFREYLKTKQIKNAVRLWGQLFFDRENRKELPGLTRELLRQL